MNLSRLPDFELLKDRNEASASVNLGRGKCTGNVCGTELKTPLTTFKAVVQLRSCVSREGPKVAAERKILLCLKNFLTNRVA